MLFITLFIVNLYLFNIQQKKATEKDLKYVQS